MRWLDLTSVAGKLHEMANPMLTLRATVLL
jgi:hypothetical protein